MYFYVAWFAFLLKYEHVLNALKIPSEITILTACLRNYDSGKLYV